MNNDKPFNNTFIGISIVDLNTAVQYKSFTAQFLQDCIRYRSHCRVSISIGDQVVTISYCLH